MRDMAETTTIAIVQMRVRRADPEANLARADAMVEEAARGGARLVCLPEMWTTGFDWDWIARNAGTQKPVIAGAGEIARRRGVWLNGSMLDVNSQGRPVNRSVLFSPEGTIAASYCKVHLFGLFREQHHLDAGDALAVAHTPLGIMGLSVCYDLRFPELFRAYALRGVQLQLLPAAFPQPRREHWRILIRARAIENQCFVAATNQVGAEDCEEVITATVDVEEVGRVRSKMTVLQDRRPEVYRS
jgi:predicted amidohydrolase